MRLRDAVSQAACEDAAKHRQSSSWLKQAAKFDHSLVLSEAKRTVAAALFSRLTQGQRLYKRHEKLRDFEVLCANLLENNRLHRAVAISFGRNDWTPQPRYRRASYFTIREVGMLAQADLIKIRRGYGHIMQGRAVRTKIWPTKEFMGLFEPIRMEDCVFDPVDLVNLRDENKKPRDYRDTRETRHVREVLRRINLITDRAKVQYVDPKTEMAYSMRTRLSCVYNLDFQHGGRFYTSDRDGYQSMSEDDRACLHIDEEPTVELDFSGMHPRLLYAWEGVQYPNDTDPYSAVLEDADLRPVLKVIFLALLNADSEVTAVRAGNKFLFDNRKYYQRLRSRGLMVKEHLIPMFNKAHAPIRKYFCTGTGLKAQNTDAKIALRVIEHFAADDIPILAVHDSFIVQRRYRGRLRRVMAAAYADVTGGFACPIK